MHVDEIEYRPTLTKILTEGTVLFGSNLELKLYEENCLKLAAVQHKK
jgi:hypothetical protein